MYANIGPLPKLPPLLLLIQTLELYSAKDAKIYHFARSPIFRLWW